MFDRSGEFVRAGGAAPIGVGFVEPERLRDWIALARPDGTVVTDPSRALYRALGLERASWRRLLSADVVRAYVRLLRAGRRLRLAREDVRQLGGDVVIDARGALAWSYRSADPADRPSVDALLDAVRSASA